MNTPPDHPLMRWYQDLHAGLDRLLATVAEYHAHCQEYEVRREQLSARDRRTCEAMLVEVQRDLLSLQQQIEVHYNRFHAVVTDIADRQLRENLDSLDADLEALWQQYRQRHQ